MEFTEIPSAYVRLSQNHIQSLVYDYLRCETFHHRIPSTEFADLVLRFEATRDFEICMNNQAISTVDELFLLHPVGCILKLVTASSRKELEIDLECNEVRLYNGGYISFSKRITPREIEYLNSWREGEELTIYWSIRGFCLLNNYNLNNHRILNTVLSIEELDSDGRLRIGPDEFDRDLIEPMGLGNRIIEELSIETPNLMSASTNAPLGIQKLIPHVILLQQRLGRAVDRFRNSRSASDYSASMGEIRTPLDTVIAFRDDPDFKSLGNELFISTGIISDIAGMPPGGAIIASQSIVNSLWGQFQQLSNINSKPLHTTTTKNTGSKNFEMEPRRIDTKFTLISCLCATNYLIDCARAALRI